MRATFASALRRWGQNVIVTTALHGEQAVRALVRPLLRDREEIPYRVTALGAVSRDRWLYLGPPEIPLSAGDSVHCSGLDLAVQECRSVGVGDEILYQRAILRKGKEIAP